MKKITDTKDFEEQKIYWEELLSKEKELEALKEENEKLKNTILKHFTEGDEDAPPEDDGGDDDSGDGSGGGAGGDGEGPDVDSEEEIEKMSKAVSNSFNMPKNLVLDDGTETNISVDSNHQSSDISEDTDTYEITFEKGNWVAFSQSAQAYSQKVTTIRQTLTPLVEKALIELLGNSGAYNRESFDVTAGFKDEEIRITAEYHYHADLWIGNEFDSADIQHDQGFIYQTISATPGIKISSTKIDTESGDVQIIASV